MKIIVSYENRVRPDSTGIYLLKAFERLGHDVTHVYPTDIHSVKPGTADLYVKCDDGLRGQVWNPELHPSAYYVIDTHIEDDWRLEFADKGKFDYVGCCQSAGTELKWNNPDVFHWPCACDPEFHYVGKREKIYDGCFIGHFHTGLGWRRMDTVEAFFSCVDKPYYGERTFKEMAEKYAQSKIVLNQAINKDLNMRFYEALCSGSCLLTERVPDLEKIGAIEDVHYVGYSDLDELKDKTRMLLKDESFREKVAAQGKDFSNSHTYVIRMGDLLDRIGVLA